MPDFLISDIFSDDLPDETSPTALPRQSIAFLNNKVSPELVFIRLAMGTASIEKTATALECRQLNDYSVFGAPLTVAATRSAFLQVLAQKGIDRKALDKHLRQNLRQTGFYQETVGELIHAIVRDAEGQHTLCFLHTYRLLERIAYAFPLIYASRTKDFKQAYTNLKKFLGGSSDTGELVFFSNFVVESLDPLLLDGTSLISFQNFPPEDKRRAYSLVREFMQGRCDVNVEGESLDLKNKAIIDLLIILRNRFFHFSPDHPSNISVRQIPDSDAFFKCFNKLFLNWILVIYFEVLRHQLP